jgi:hypothetical protein
MLFLNREACPPQPHPQSYPQCSDCHSGTMTENKDFRLSLGLGFQQGTLSLEGLESELFNS